MLASRRRHDTVMLPTPPTGNSVCSSHEKPNRRTIQVKRQHRSRQGVGPGSLLHRTRKITPQFPITWKGICAIWMPGNEAQSATARGIRDAGFTNSHVIHYYFGHRHALTALGREDL